MFTKTIRYSRLEMDEKKLTKISLVGSLVSLIALYFVVSAIEVSQIEIGNIDQTRIGSQVKVIGEISNFKDSGHFFFRLNDETGSIKVVIWQNIVEELEMSNFETIKIKNGAIIEIIGEVEFYKGELEITPIRSQIKLV